MSKREGHQLERLAEQQLALQAQEALEANAVWYYTRTMCQIYLPADTYTRTEFRRDSGNYHLVVQALPPLHVPWGIYPRGILNWVVTEVVRRKREGEAARTLHLGSSLAEFMEQVSGSRSYSGGKSGNIHRFKRQLSSLFSSRVAFWIGKDAPDIEVDQGGSMQIGVGWNLMWHTKLIDQPGLLQSTVQLSQEFFEDCLKHPVPVDVRIIRALWPNCLAFDTYVWLTYKAYVMRVRRLWALELPWEALKLQFGFNYRDPARFRHKFLEALTRVRLLYPSMEFEERTGKGMTFRFKRPSVVSVPVRFHIESTHTRES